MREYEKAVEDLKNKQLFQSKRWAGFFKTTATGLGLSLTLFDTNDDYILQAPTVCPLCSATFIPLSYLDKEAVINNNSSQPFRFTTEAGENAVAVKLKDFYLVGRECKCNGRPASHDLSDRVIAANKLLTSFRSILEEGLGEQSNVELLTLRRINQLILSFFDGDTGAVDSAFDLILSALVVLLNAKGSWLKYSEFSQRRILSKGNKQVINSALKEKSSNVYTVNIKCNHINGHLGVVDPKDPQQANVLVPLMAQECVIVFEIKNLFALFQEKVSRVLGAVHSAVVMVDRHGKISYMNQAAEEILQQQVVDMIGLPASKLPAPWSAYIAEPKVSSGMMERVGSPTDSRWVDWQIYDLQEGSDILGRIVLIHDRTDYYRWREAARRAERTAATAKLVTTVAHETRNPMGVVKGILQLLSQSRDPVKIKDYADLALHELDRLNCLINKFLLLDKSAQVKMKPINMEEYINEIAPLLKKMATEAGSKLLLNLEKVESIMADPEQLTHAILSITQNAVEATGEHGKISIDLKQKGSKVLLQVHDNGAGFSSRVREQMFQPFFTTKENRSGLGLAVAQSIVHNNGGDITVALSPQGGSVFTLVFNKACPEGGTERERVDVILALSDTTTRYICEQVLKAAGAHVISSPNLIQVLGGEDNSRPTAVILESFDLRAEELAALREAVQKASAPKFFILGEPTYDLDESRNVQCIPYPVDYADLTGRVMLALEKN